MFYKWWMHNGYLLSGWLDQIMHNIWLRIRGALGVGRYIWLWCKWLYSTPSGTSNSPPPQSILTKWEENNRNHYLIKQAFRLSPSRNHNLCEWNRPRMVCENSRLIFLGMVSYLSVSFPSFHLLLRSYSLASNFFHENALLLYYLRSLQENGK